MTRYYISEDGKDILRENTGTITIFRELSVNEGTARVHVVSRTEIKSMEQKSTLKFKPDGKARCICSLCGEAGHRKTTCPKNRGGKVDGFLPPDIVETIHALKEEGMTSDQVASELDLDIAAVNKHWVKKSGEKNPHNNT